MSLTDQDLLKIREVVVEVVDKSIIPMRKDIAYLKKGIIFLKKEMRQVKKTLDVAIKMFDEQLVALARRVKRLEDRVFAS